MKNLIFYLFFLNLFFCASAQIINHKKTFTKQDSLRGSNNEFRDWWNVKQYFLDINPNFEEKSLVGTVKINSSIEKIPQKWIMQIDLQEPLNLNSYSLTIQNKNNEITLPNQQNQQLKREGNVYFLDLSFYREKLKQVYENNVQFGLVLTYSGKPRIAKNAPWDGGWIFKTDKEGRPWMSAACQGLGASVWYPNKDYLGDEPEEGVKFNIYSHSKAIGNGKLVSKQTSRSSSKTQYLWETTQPINNYNVIPYIGNYVNFKDSYQGENGNLSLDYWVLDYNLEKAKTHFEQVKPMMACFEDWLGPYPFYEDSFKLVESPYLGMEHQSNIAYGNDYRNGYLGKDLSGTGVGLLWDFIIIHESGHEWFGNNITVKDIADLWIHESFTAYTEVLYTGCQQNLQAANNYIIGTRKSIQNDIPMIGVYGVNQEGSGDVYYKGANMIHTLRQLIDDDAKFKKLLRGLNKDFWHKTITTQEIERYISDFTQLDLSQFFHQYLRTTKIPTLKVVESKRCYKYYWTNVVDGFDMPIKLKNGRWIYPEKGNSKKISKRKAKKFELNPNFFVKLEYIPLPN